MQKYGLMNSEDNSNFYVNSKNSDQLEFEQSLTPRGKNKKTKRINEGDNSAGSYYTAKKMS